MRQFQEAQAKARRREKGHKRASSDLRGPPSSSKAFGEGEKSRNMDIQQDVSDRTVPNANMQVIDYEADTMPAIPRDSEEEREQ